jgi:hypothetical protein
MEFPNVEELHLYFSEGNKTGRVRAFPGEGLDLIWILDSSTDGAVCSRCNGVVLRFFAESFYFPAQLNTALAIYHVIFNLLLT